MLQRKSKEVQVFSERYATLLLHTPPLNLLLAYGYICVLCKQHLCFDPASTSGPKEISSTSSNFF